MAKRRRKKNWRWGAVVCCVAVADGLFPGDARLPVGRPRRGAAPRCRSRRLTSLPTSHRTDPGAASQSSPATTDSSLPGQPPGNVEVNSNTGGAAPWPPPLEPRAPQHAGLTSSPSSSSASLGADASLAPSLLNASTAPPQTTQTTSTTPPPPPPQGGAPAAQARAKGSAATPPGVVVEKDANAAAAPAAAAADDGSTKRGALPSSSPLPSSPLPSSSTTPAASARSWLLDFDERIAFQVFQRQMAVLLKSVSPRQLYVSAARGVAKLKDLDINAKAVNTLFNPWAFDASLPAQLVDARCDRASVAWTSLFSLNRDPLRIRAPRVEATLDFAAPVPSAKEAALYKARWTAAAGEAKPHTSYPPVEGASFELDKVVCTLKHYPLGLPGYPNATLRVEATRPEC